MRFTLTTSSQNPSPTWFSRVFINRDVFCLWSGQVISETGSSVFRIALMWMVLELTGSKSMTGLIVMLGSLPSLLLGPYSGALVDRLDRRRTMLVSDLARAGLVMIIPLLFFVGGLTPWVLGLVIFAMASFNTFYLPARDSLVGQIVAPGDRLGANTMIQTSWQYAILLGPAIVALALRWLSQANLFVLDAASYVVSFLFIFRIGSSKGGFRRPNPAEFVRVLAGGWADTLAGLKYVFGEPRLRALLLVTAADNLFLMGPAVLGVPIFVKDVLKQDLESFAFVSIATAVGMITSTILLRRFGRGLSNSRLIVWGIILDGLTFVPMLWVHSLGGMFVTMMVHAMAIPLIIVCRPNIIHNIVPTNMQGRVFSLISAAVFGFMSLSTVLTGVLAEYLPISYIYAGSGVLAASTGVIGWMLGGFRNLD